MKDDFGHVPLVGSGPLPGAPTAEDLQRQQQLEQALNRAAGLAAMRNEFAAAALGALIVIQKPQRGEYSRVVAEAMAWGQLMADEAGRLLEADLARAMGQTTEAGS